MLDLLLLSIAIYPTGKEPLGITTFSKSQVLSNLPMSILAHTFRQLLEKAFYP
jgi:hypothetical protein